MSVGGRVCSARPCQTPRPGQEPISSKSSTMITTPQRQSHQSSAPRTNARAEHHALPSRNSPRGEFCQEAGLSFVVILLLRKKGRRFGKELQGLQPGFFLVG